MTFISRAGALLSALSLAACASLPAQHGYEQARQAASERLDARIVATDSAIQAAPLPSAPLSQAEAVQLALLYHPDARLALSRIGLGRAELEDARRLANPAFSYQRLHAEGGRQITRSLSFGLSDLLLLADRKRFATAELERLQVEVAADLLALAQHAEQAWIEAVSAQQVAQMRGLVAQAAEASAALAQRFFAAGNINRRELAQQQAAASAARIDALRADAAALRTRAALAAVTTLPVEADWQPGSQLPAPPAIELDVQALLARALQQRFDLQAAERQLRQLEDALGVTRRWRWLGEVEFEYERESEANGERLYGPALSIELPIFNQQQGAIERRRAELAAAQAELQARLWSVQAEVRVELQSLALQRQVVERYRQGLLPQREAIVERGQEEVNFMLHGIFELLAERQEQYDAYQEYLEAVRDFWLSYAALKASVGGTLPELVIPAAATLGVEPWLPSSVAPAIDHSQHHGMSHGSPAAPAADPEPAAPHAHDAATPPAAPAAAAHEHGDSA